jgi:hypothetical protein
VTHAIVRFGTPPLALKDWQAFCAEQQLKHSGMAGGNMWVRGGRTGIEAAFGQPTRGVRDPPPPDDAVDVVFSTPFGGEKARELAKLAGAFWVRFGGAMWAEETVREMIVGDG